ncbi:histidine phosphatase superfamily [Rhodocollybia butyracea]|uniref:Histidine phosphatase superfamily n=1 Tax=Rhodocollybia butyracea TaxID=206335 RepID=A0A9P5PGZ7_9AGAR|nr:histidine phosphatase superfamily [Rhodocollybia butyracea]
MTVSNNQNKKNKKPWKCLVLSLIRHAQARSNTHGWAAGPDSALTPHGHTQADALASKWSRVLIDKLISSHLQRALTTASILSAANAEHSKNRGYYAVLSEDLVSVDIDPRVQERKCGELVPRLSLQRQKIDAYHALTGTTVRGRIARNHTPPEGGESLDAVAERAKDFVLSIMEEHGDSECGSFGPEDFQLWKWKSEDAEKVPSDIPHVTVVSHNVFLGELYEAMYFWHEGRSQRGLLGVIGQIQIGDLPLNVFFIVSFF